MAFSTTLYEDVFGSDFAVDPQTEVRLRKAGVPDIVATMAQVSDPTVATGQFSMAGVSPGDWRVVVRNPTGKTSNPSTEFAAVTACDRGACCVVGPDCIEGVTENDCTNSGGEYAGDATRCSTPGCQ